MRRKKIWLNIIAVSIVLICSAVIGTMMNADSSNELMVAVVSLGVALLALYISLKTFYSIDEVNAISRMDGNVMENPRYHPNLLRAVFRFPQVSFSETSKALMDYMEDLFSNKRKQSGAHLADNVQEVSDLLVLVPYFIKTNNQEESSIQLKRISTLLNNIKNKVDNFKEISDGSCKLLEETYNLIDSVFSYQRMTATGESDPTKLLEIRGSIFINPVACTLYYDYLGLYFLKRAKLILNKYKTGLTLKELIECVKYCSSDDKAMVHVYCDKAIDAFKHAKENIGNDMIWTGFICFNIARAIYLRQLISNSFENKSSQISDDTKYDWETYINESISSWITANKIIAEHFTQKLSNRQVSWLQQAFISEEKSVRLSKIVMQIMSHHPLTDYNKNPWVKKYGDITETPFFKSIPDEDPQKLTDSLVADIRELIKQ